MKKFSTERLSQSIQKDMERASVVSFDIFDTLLARPYARPSDLFWHMGKIYQQADFAQKRIQAEKDARAHHPELKDITLQMIYDEFGDDPLDMQHKEVEWEEKVLRPRQLLFDLYHQALKAGKTVVIISDMYLSADILMHILSKNGYAAPTKMYISCDYNATKRDGSLFDIMLKDLNVKASEVLHIGDHPKSDYLSAKKRGLRALLINKPIEELFDHNKRAKRLYAMRKDPECSILLGLLSLSDSLNSSDIWHRLGMFYAGPVIFAYMQWLKSTLETRAVKDVMFVARDGYTLEKVFNLITKHSFRTHYFYAPRLTNLVTALDYKNQCHTGECEGIEAIRSILNYFKRKNDDLAVQAPDISSIREGEDFLKSHADIYQKLADAERKDWKAYLQTFHLTDTDIAVVDSRSTMLSTQKALINGLPDKHICGFYWSTGKENAEDIARYDTTTFTNGHEAPFIDWNLMEFYMTAPTPPVERLDKGMPVFKPINPFEAARIAVYPAVSEGILDFARHAYDIFGDADLGLSASIATDWTNVFCAYPTKEDKKAFENLQHAYDSEHTQYMPMPKTWFKRTKKTTDTPLWTFMKIPVLSQIRKNRKTTTLLFSILPIWQVKQYENHQTSYLFSLLPICKTKAHRSL